MQLILTDKKIAACKAIAAEYYTPGSPDPNNTLDLLEAVASIDDADILLMLDDHGVANVTDFLLMVRSYREAIAAGRRFPT